jgi:DNA-binding response OmpR family regulator
MKTVLLVDDDDTIRDVLSIFLKKSGFDVMTAASGAECIGAVQVTKPDLVILDIVMQPMDGWETLTSIREDPGMQCMPIAMFSGKTPISEEIERYGGWIEDYLLKPITYAQLSDALTMIFDRSAGIKLSMERMKAFGADPCLIDEWCFLTRSLFIKKKFIPSRHNAGREYDGEISSIESRISKLISTIEGQHSLLRRGSSLDL